MKTITILALVAVGILAAGCDEQKQTTDTGAQGAAEIKDEDIPTQADFDDEAEKQITTANYKSELDSLEKEISAE